MFIVKVFCRFILGEGHCKPLQRTAPGWDEQGRTAAVSIKGCRDGSHFAHVQRRDDECVRGEECAGDGPME